MSSHRCSAPYCEEPADPSVAFCSRHSADSSGRFARLVGRLTSLGKAARLDYQGDIASVSRAQDDTFIRNAEQRAWVAKKRAEPPAQSNG